ncbi:Flp family type IVb pilin [Vibrio sp. JC009]|uniref:Flp family type IVb pilin n=1 Tax=Vibrio sp. JC009 TaxID=2912314 RepID=UPI0023AFEF3C|nr:Flp family type IVb pilin [Vibrio sp. JC009]WED23310.1 Flp family type IVb pilin [Vibrio sp. JC009]
MEKIYRTIKNFLLDEEGLTVVEYVVGAAFLVGGMALFFSNYGNTLNGSLNSSLDKAGSG